MKKFSFYIFLTICINLYGKSQCSIGQTEQEIRSEYSENPNAGIYEKYIQGEKNLIIVDRDATASFNISNESKLCYRSMFQFRNHGILQDLVTKMNSNYQIVTRGAAWRTSLKGHIIKIELRYSTKLQSDVLVAYLLDE